MGGMILVLSVIGTVNSFTPVPYWDSWNGELEFIMRVRDGDHSLWLAQHNEHRIFLARVLFFADHQLFGGQAFFLFFCNIAFAASAAIVLGVLARKHLASSHRSSFLAALALVLGLSVSWIQSENLTWSFQNQFFLSQLVPLLSFFSLSYASTERHSSIKTDAAFWAAAILGILSLGTMANGVLALPLLIIQAVLMRMDSKRLATLITVTMICLPIYFNDYQSTNTHGSASGLLYHPLSVLDFLIIYLGSPISHITSAGGNVVVARLFGTLFIAAAIWQLLTFLRTKRNVDTRAALLTFIAYIGLTAAITALGRFEFGPEYALTGRYTTPTLLGWAAISILIIGDVSERRDWTKHVANGLALLALSGLTLNQLSALSPKDQFRFERMVMALAVELDVKDDELTRQIIPLEAPFMRDIATAVATRKMSAFSSPLLAGRQDQLGQSAFSRPRAESAACVGHIDSIAPLPADATFARVEGWLHSPRLSNKMESVRFIDGDGDIAGFAIYGKPRPDVETVIAAGIERAGFVGYIQTDALGGALTYGPSSGGCEISAFQGEFAYSVFPQQVTNTKTVSVSAMNSEGDFANRIPAPLNTTLIAFGSNSQGDMGTGTLKLKMNPGEGFYYVSGPNASRQTIQVLDQEGFLSSAPQVVNWQTNVDTQWSYLAFNNALLTEPFEVWITDSGDGWGEWSGVALRAAD